MWNEQGQFILNNTYFGRVVEVGPHWVCYYDDENNPVAIAEDEDLARLDVETRAELEIAALVKAIDEVKASRAAKARALEDVAQQGAPS